MSNKERVRIKVILPPFYRNLIIAVFTVTIVLGGGFMYYTFGSAKVIIHPSLQKITNESTVDIKESPSAAELEDGEAIEGRLYSFDIDDTFAVPSTGKKEVQDDTLGKVTLYNNYSKDQKLIATTRLQAKDGTVVRIKNEVNVPAGKTVEVSVYADKPETFKDLAKQHLIIPGLWEGLQDKIYGENSTTLKKGGHTISLVTEDDLKNIEKSLGSKIDEKVLERLKAELTEEKLFHSKLIQKEILEQSFDAKAGDERDSINVTLKVRAAVVVFDEIQLLNTMRKKVASELSAGKTLKDLDAKSIVYTVEKYDIDSKTANIKVYVEGTSAVKSENGIFEKDKIFGKSKQEVIDYYKAFPEVESVKVEFFPSWVWRVPNSDDKVEISIDR